MKEGADWLAWSMQFVAGLVAGSFVGVLFYPDGAHSIPFFSREAWPEFLLGVALLGAGLGSYYGDVLWIGDSYRVIPPDRMQHSVASRRASFFVGACGVIRILFRDRAYFWCSLGILRMRPEAIRLRRRARYAGNQGRVSAHVLLSKAN